MESRALATIVAESNGKIVNVTFTKKDGTDRTMRCTRNPDLMPAGAVRGTDTRKDQGNLIAVWDLDAGAWKGFFYDKMVACQPA